MADSVYLLYKDRIMWEGNSRTSRKVRAYATHGTALGVAKSEATNDAKDRVSKMGLKYYEKDNEPLLQQFYEEELKRYDVVLFVRQD